MTTCSLVTRCLSLPICHITSPVGLVLNRLDLAVLAPWISTNYALIFFLFTRTCTASIVFTLTVALAALKVQSIYYALPQL
jgi:hypothetical protein